MQLKEVKPVAALIKSMHSLSNHVRMLAVMSVALLAENQAATWQRRCKTRHRGFQWSDRDEALQVDNKVTDKLVQALERLLDDSVVRVKVPSAITLYAINRHTTKVRLAHIL